MGYKILSKVYTSKGHIVFFNWKGLGDDAKESYIAQTSAIRDRILAGIQRREWTEEDVEGLAKVLRAAHAVHFKSEPNAYWLDGFRTEARAALAWFDGKRGEWWIKT